MKANEGGEVWRLARAASGVSIGQGKRHFTAARTMVPTLEEWILALAKAGPDGGCEAIRVDYEGDRRKLMEEVVDLGGAGYTTERFQVGKLAGCFGKMKRGKAVPEGCVPKEVWQLLCERGYGHSCRG